MSENVFSGYSRYYDLLYRDKDYVAESNYIRDLLERFGVSGTQLLEFGSGTGKHGRLLAEIGFRVTGIERSAEMVARTESTQGFSCQQGDICSLKLDRTFSAVLSLFHVVSYQTTDANLQAVFERAAEHLETGGLFVFDFWYSPAVSSQSPEVRVKRMADDEVEIIRIAEPLLRPNENCVDVNYTIFARNRESAVIESMTEIHPMRHFSLPEIDLLGKLTGFKRLGAEEFLTKAEPGPNTWGVCVILQKV